jgi:flagellar secretion chaperone FliS
MYTQSFHAAKQYATIGVETGVSAASPHKLIVMLFEGAQISLNEAIRQLQRGDAQRKGAAIGKAVTIISEGLLTSLDLSVNTSLAQQLAQLYQYMIRRLIAANAHDDAAGIEEVKVLLNELGQAWSDIAPTR